MRRIRSLPRFIVIGLFLPFIILPYQPRAFSATVSRPPIGAPGFSHGAEAPFGDGFSAGRPERPRPQTRPRWVTPVPISNADPDNPPNNPDVAVCRDGTVHVVWEQAGRIWHNYRTPEGNWNGPQAIVAQSPFSPPQELKGNTPAIAITADCRVFLAWSRDWGGAANILFARWDGAAWWGFTNVSDTGAQSLHPDIVVTSFDEPRIVWAEGTPLNPSLYWGQPTAGLEGLWSKVPICDSRGDFPSLVFDMTDRSHLVWQQRDEQRIDVHYTQQEQSAEPGQSDVWPCWSLRIPRSPTPSSLPRTAIMDGNPVVVWVEKVGENQRSIYGGRAVERWSWTGPEKLSGDHNVKGGNPPAIAAGRTGPAHLAWAEKNPRDAIAYTILWPSGNGLLSTSSTPPEEITNGGQDHRKPAIATSEDGARVYLVWVETDARGISKVYFSESEGRVFYFYIPLMARQTH